MHKLNVTILGPSSFISTLNELKSSLNFNIISASSDTKYDIILFHNDALNDNKQFNFIKNSNSIKICASDKKIQSVNYDVNLNLPASLKEINTIVENIVAKKRFSRNSSIKVNEYLLDKNEKKLLKSKKFVPLTEKEIKLLELFLINKKPISKDKILISVWNYSSEADTHTVETHIYRLRKKISEEFMDENFIQNNKDGYFL